MEIDSMMVARALHVLAVIVWVGGEALETFVVLPEIRRIADRDEKLRFFDQFEHRFAQQTRWTLAIIFLTGLYMLIGQDAWLRFLDPNHWWLYAMIFAWSICFIYVFVIDPYIFYPWFKRRAEVDMDAALDAVVHQHWALMVISLITVLGTVAGVHGAVYFG